MAVFQAIVETSLHYGYDHFKLLEGQLVTANEPKLLHFLARHVNFREITDDTLIKLAPPLYLIKQITSPSMMRKEEIIMELRSYGIKVDPYCFSSQLSMQLELARRLKKRNFLTVLNSEGRAVYIDRVNLPTPVINEIDKTLSEPEDPKGDFFKIAEYLPEKEEKKPKEIEKTSKNEVMMVTRAYDENEINEGKEFTEFCAQFHEDNEIEFKAQIERERVTKELLWKEQPVIIDEKIKDIERLVDNSLIIPENFAFLLEITGGKFMLNPPEEEEKDDLRVHRAMSRYSLDVIETYLRHHGIRVEYDYSDGKKHSMIGKVVEEVLNKYEGKDKEWQLICLNMLQKRYDEIVDHEPDYRKCSTQALRKQCAKTNQYGMHVAHSSIKEYKFLLSYTLRLFQFMKLGLNMPSEDKMREALIYHRRFSKLDTDDPLRPKSFKKPESINTSESLETPQDV